MAYIPESVEPDAQPNPDDEIVDAEIIDDEQDALDELRDSFGIGEDEDPDDIDAISDSMKAKVAALNSEERKRAALQLRLGGATYVQIGKALGVDQSTARKHVKSIMDDMKMEGATELKRIQYMRLEHMLMLQWPRVQEKSDSAMNMAMSIMDRQTRLLGLDAAARLDVDVSSGTQINVGGDKETFINDLMRARAALNVASAISEDDEPLYIAVDAPAKKTPAEVPAGYVAPETIASSGSNEHY